ncbi:MAG: hypothetical protein LBD48_13140 [Treponema sp.]|jgi:hypothetical protein|nr:hypothetical protein [Treponema sp.]
MDNGNWEGSVDGIPQVKGTYTAAGGKLTLKSTHVHGAWYGGQYGIESKWYSKDELKTALKQAIPGMTDEEFEEDYSHSGWFRESTGDYSVNGNTLTLTDENGGTTTWTRE